MKTKLAFFDVDGTLSVPIYRNNGQDVIGFSLENWIRYCVENGEETYAYCKPVPAVKAYAAKKKAEGARLFVLTTAATSFEVDAKKVFLEKYYAGLFEDVIAVAEDELKATIILMMADKLGVRPEECELVEDKYMLLLDAIDTGIQITHISQLYAGDA